MLEAQILPLLISPELTFRRGDLKGSVRNVCLACSRYRKLFTEYANAREWAESLSYERDADADRALIAVTKNCEDIALLELVSAGDTLTIALLLVSSSSRFHGIGRACVRAVENAAKVAGYAALSLGVHSNNEAMTFWGRAGFSDCGFLGRGDHGILQMERVLDRPFANAQS